MAAINKLPKRQAYPEIPNQIVINNHVIDLLADQVNQLPPPEPLESGKEDMHFYLAIPRPIILPFHHTQLHDDTQIELPATVNQDVNEILQQIRYNRKKSFTRVTKTKRNTLLIKLGWISKLLWEELIVQNLKNKIGSKFAQTKKSGVHSLYIFNLCYLEFLLGARWWVETIYLKGTNMIEGYVLANDLCGVRVYRSCKTGQLHISVPLRFVNHVGFHQFGM
eukprot:TRINITY_DN3396_c0_g1_i2.p1 TRINITY_DN3396_c0_g1~~TRINITY_DN3396_c0_g1_i2.p1  ORF type:complete len:222 (+),score=22.64 TRINITY_DN3396_c0_g1_i2:245-910(+)